MTFSSFGRRQSKIADRHSARCGYLQDHRAYIKPQALRRKCDRLIIKTFIHWSEMGSNPPPPSQNFNGKPRTDSLVSIIHTSPPTAKNSTGGVATRLLGNNQASTTPSSTRGRHPTAGGASSLLRWTHCHYLLCHHECVCIFAFHLMEMS